MFGIMFRKLWHKKWMFCCMLMGSLLLIATASSYPMYQDAVFNYMLQDEYEAYLETQGKWPMSIDMVIISKKNAEGAVMRSLETFTDSVDDELGLTEKENIRYYSMAATEAVDETVSGDGAGKDLRLGYLSQLPEHARLMDGEMYSESGLSQDGYIEVVISQAAMIAQNMYVGEKLEFSSLKAHDGQPLKLVVTGIFAEENADDFYWQEKPSSMANACLMEEKLFTEYFTGANADRYTITCNYHKLFEYQDVSARQVEQLIAETDYMTETGKYRNVMSKPEYVSVLTGYQDKENRISSTLFILEVPVMLLLCAFLFMISGQMYEMERNDISMLKSRGASRFQIFRLYLYQSVFLSLLGCAIGLPLGSVFARILGSANNFLEFGIHRELSICYSDRVFLFAGGAALVSILITTVPALKHSMVTIVHLKQQKAAGKKSWWEKCFLDVVFLGISIYGYYNYSNHTADIMQRALKGEPLDPLLYISSSLFILGLGMFFLRLQPLLASGLYAIGKKHWKPASYASFLETIKNGRKQQYIMLFMILTVSLGMFNAVSARTILQNTLDNTDYMAGADLIIQEVWTDNSAFAATDPSIEFRYYEPDYAKYAELEGASSYTKVLMDKKAYVIPSGNERIAATVMGIHTKEFGACTWVSKKLLGKSYDGCLNALAAVPNGVLVSDNFRTKLNYKVGDQIAYYSNTGAKAMGTIVDFVSYWPSYEAVTVTLDAENNIKQTDNYLVVSNIAATVQYWGTTPYQVWIGCSDKENTDFFYDWIDRFDVQVQAYSDRSEKLEKVIEDPLLQGMNGVLTMSFIVTIILCAVGYLIYWIMSIRSREMMFGILRAFGMHKEELFHMLLNEQVFSGFSSILYGAAIGRVAYALFVPMLQTAYSTSSQVLPLTLITQTSDLVRLFTVIGMTMAACLLILTTLVLKLNITKALKLGEE